MDNDNTLKSGTCPKCGGREIYTTRDISKRGERMQLVVSSVQRFFLDTYICTSCFHFEEYVSEKEKADEKIIAKIKETWNKV
jgi:predicted nucleic-acid-binding Zn-ribbon protein